MSGRRPGANLWQDDELGRVHALLRAQLGSAAAWQEALRVTQTTDHETTMAVSQELRAASWLERELKKDSDPGEREVHEFYERERARFVVPELLRASHLFLAAHAETLPDDMETKRRAIEDLHGRILKGELLGDLATMFSGDEASKPRRGDLGFFGAGQGPGGFPGCGGRPATG